MSGEVNEGKWYVPRDLGIIKATEELDGKYYRYKGEDGKDRWIPAKVFIRKYKDIEEVFLGEESMERVLNFYVGDAPRGASDVMFKHFKTMLAEFGEILMAVIFASGKAWKENEDGRKQDKP